MLKESKHNVFPESQPQFNIQVKCENISTAQ